MLEFGIDGLEVIFPSKRGDFGEFLPESLESEADGDIVDVVVADF